MRALTLGGVRVSDTDPCYVIAEAGSNHGGEFSRAVDLLLAAQACGCSAVKFQKRANRDLYTRDFYTTPYAHEHSYGATYGAHREALELSVDNFSDLFALGRHEHITTFATVFEERSLDQLMRLRMPIIKIASGDLTNLPLITEAARYGVPVILSTGGATWEDVDRAVNAVLAKHRQLVVLHCTSGYPVHQHAELNLRAIPTMRDRYPEIVIGWSGHDTGIAMSLMAYTLGARVIEKHFTLNRTWKGTDQAFSLEPGGMRRMVRDLGRARQAWGTGEKVPYPSESAPLSKMRKCLVATRPLMAGQVLRTEDLARKSPAPEGSLPPYLLASIVGFPLTQSVGYDEPLTYAHLQARATA